MADIDIGQLARSLGNIFAIFQQNKENQRRETKSDARFAQQQQNFLATQQISREREDRLAAESERNIASKKADRKRDQMIMFVDMYRQFGAEIGAKAATAMGATPEELQALSTLVGIKNASRPGQSSTSGCHCPGSAPEH